MLTCCSSDPAYESPKGPCGALLTIPSKNLGSPPRAQQKFLGTGREGNGARRVRIGVQKILGVGPTSEGEPPPGIPEEELYKA
jgi:hypothetical protein